MLDHAALLALAGSPAVDLYLVDGLPLWEASRSPRHQHAIDRIRKTITPGGDCAGYDLANTWLSLGPRTLVSPDIAIYRVEPPAVDVALTIVPVAVIEVLHPDYAAKDRALVPVYQAAGVLDVVLFDPETGSVTHTPAAGWWPSCTPRRRSPCAVVVPCISRDCTWPSCHLRVEPNKRRGVAVDVRAWWERTTERDQDSVLYHVSEPRGWAGVPWAFLPEEVQAVLTRRVRVRENLLAPDWQRTTAR